MKNDLLKKFLPHLIAIAIFLIAAIIYCSPALQGKVVSQHDITSWKGAIQKSIEYKEVHGEYPLWINTVFSGMPGFQIGAPGNSFIPSIVHKVLTLGLPEPIQFFFLACICFYFLCIVLRLRPVVGILGAGVGGGSGIINAMGHIGGSIGNVIILDGILIIAGCVCRRSREEYHAIGRACAYTGQY